MKVKLGIDRHCLVFTDEPRLVHSTEHKTPSTPLNFIPLHLPKAFLDANQKLIEEIFFENLPHVNALDPMLSLPLADGSKSPIPVSTDVSLQSPPSSAQTHQPQSATLNASLEFQFSEEEISFDDIVETSLTEKASGLRLQLVSYFFSVFEASE